MELVAISQFGRLTVYSNECRDGAGRRLAAVGCECGKLKVVHWHSLTSGRTRSCGCLHRETVRRTSRRHGETTHATKSREYAAWIAAKARCGNPNSTAFHRYGGRGISMSVEWVNDFSAFLAHVGRCPPGKTLDRIDNNKGYEPGNVRWATMKEQAQNRG